MQLKMADFKLGGFKISVSTDEEKPLKSEKDKKTAIKGVLKSSLPIKKAVSPAVKKLDKSSLPVKRAVSPAVNKLKNSSKSEQVFPFSFGSTFKINSPKTVPATAPKTFPATNPKTALATTRKTAPAVAPAPTAKASQKRLSTTSALYPISFADYNEFRPQSTYLARLVSWFVFSTFLYAFLSS